MRCVSGGSHLGKEAEKLNLFKNIKSKFDMSNTRITYLLWESSSQAKLLISSPLHSIKDSTNPLIRIFCYMLSKRITLLKQIYVNEIDPNF